MSDHQSPIDSEFKNSESIKIPDPDTVILRIKELRYTRIRSIIDHIVDEICKSENIPISINLNRVPEWNKLLPHDHDAIVEIITKRGWNVSRYNKSEIKISIPKPEGQKTTIESGADDMEFNF